MPENYGGGFVFFQLVINCRVGIGSINGPNEKSIDLPREEPSDARGFAFGIVQRLGEDYFVAQLVGLFLDGHKGACVNWIGQRGNDKTELMRLARAQSARGMIGDVADFCGERFDACLGFRGNIRLVA